MKAYLIWLIVLLSYLYEAFGSQWKVEYFTETGTTPQKVFTGNKGHFFQIKLKLSSQDGSIPAVGNISLTDEFFQLAGPAPIDTTNERTYSLFIGVSCVAPLDYNHDYPISLSLTPPSTEMINWEQFSIRFENKKIPITIQLERTVLEQGSYSLYSLSHVRNFDQLFLSFKYDIAKIKADIKVLPKYKPSARGYFKVYGAFGSTYSDSQVEYTMEPVLDDITAKCYYLTATVLSWKMSSKNLPDVLDKKELILIDTEVDKPSKSILQFHLKVEFKPVLISCGISSKRDMSLLTPEIVTDPAAFAEKTGSEFDMAQTYHQVEGTAKMLFHKANRFAMSFTAICYIQVLLFRSNDFQTERLGIVLANSGERDKTLALKAEAPFPTQCLRWKFSSNIDKSEFDAKMITYCRSYFSKEKALKERGCLVCDLWTTPLFSSSEAGICVRSDIACEMNYEGSIKDDVALFLNTINTFEKMKTVLGLSISGIGITNITHSSDDDKIDPNTLIVKISKIDRKSIYLSLNATVSNQTLQCLIKPITKKPFTEVTEGDFEDEPQLLDVVPWKTDYSLSFTKEGYDNSSYNIIAMCYNFAAYPYHSRHSPPFILTTFLRTNATPITVPPKDKVICGNDTVHPQCIAYEPKAIPKLLSNDYKADIAHELEDFARMSQGYIYIELEDEYNEYLQVKLKWDIIDKTIYILELLSKINCIKHTDFDYCRELKRKYLSLLINNYLNLFSGEDLIKSIEDIGAQYRRNIPLIATALFDMTNNPDGFTEGLYKKLVAFMRRVVQSHDAIISITEKQKPASPLQEDIDNNKVLISSAKKDFTHLLLLAHVNLMDITTYLEADKAKPFEKNATTEMILDDSINTIYNGIETLLPYFASNNYRKVNYENFQLQIFSKSVQENSDIYIINFDFFDIRVDIQKVDVFKKVDVDYIFIYAMKKHPFLSHYAKEYHRPSVFFRLYNQLSNGTVVKSEREVIEPNLKISYNMNKINASFLEAFSFNNTKKLFVTENCKLKVVKEQELEYTHLTIYKVGDYTFGVTKTSGKLWLIITLVVVSFILVVGVAFFLYSYMKKKKKKDSHSSEGIQPIVDG